VKRLFLALACLSILTVGGGIPARAQTAAPAASTSQAPPSPEKMKSYLKELNLAPPQAMKIAGILKEAKNKQEDPQATLERVKAVLTKEQQARLEKLIGQIPASPAPAH
jgi:hypothetical protein